MLPAAVPADDFDCTDTQIDALSSIGGFVAGGPEQRYTSIGTQAIEKLEHAVPLGSMLGV